MNARQSNALPSVAELKALAAGRWFDILIAAGIDADKLNGKGHSCPKCGGRDCIRCHPPFIDTRRAFCSALGATHHSLTRGGRSVEFGLSYLVDLWELLRCLDLNAANSSILPRCALFMRFNAVCGGLSWLASTLRRGRITRFVKSGFGGGWRRWHRCSGWTSSPMRS